MNVEIHLYNLTYINVCFGPVFICFVLFPCLFTIPFYFLNLFISILFPHSFFQLSPFTCLLVPYANELAVIQIVSWGRVFAECLVDAVIAVHKSISVGVFGDKGGKL